MRYNTLIIPKGNTLVLVGSKPVIFYEFDFQTLISKTEMFNGKKKSLSTISSVEKSESTNESKLSAKQLLEVSQNISKYYVPRISLESKGLTLLSIDPHNFYVYWSLGNVQDEVKTDSEQGKQLSLRVYSQHNEGCEVESRNKVFETLVSGLQSRQKMNVTDTEFKSSSKHGAIYSASIGRYNAKNSFLPLINSNEIYDSGSVIANQNQAHSNSSDSREIHDRLIEGGKDAVSHNGVSVKSHYASTISSGQGNKK